MAMPKNLVLVRHGESEGNVAVKSSKKGDDSFFSEEFRNRHNSLWRLTDKGIDQAVKAGDWIKKNITDNFSRYYVSQSLRAMETAVYLNLPKASWFTEFYLRERDWGVMDIATEYEKKTKFGEETKRRKIEPFYFAPAGGESIAQLCLRIDRVIDTLHRECDREDVIIVCHGEVMWAFRIRLERMMSERYHKLDNSSSPFDKIHNCQILHYTRANPKTSEMDSYLNWMKSICPWDTSLSRNKWEKIERPKYSNEDLLNIIGRFPRIINEV